MYLSSSLVIPRFLEAPEKAHFDFPSHSANFGMPKIRLSMEWLVYPRLETALTLFHFRTRGGKEIEKHGGNFSAFVPYHLTLLLALLYLRKEHAISMSLSTY